MNQSLHLGPGCLNYLLITVASVDHRNARKTIDVVPALGIGNRGPVSPLDYHGLHLLHHADIHIFPVLFDCVHILLLQSPFQR